MIRKDYRGSGTIPLDEFRTRFSGFIELQKSGVKQALQHAGYGVHEFAEWIKSDRIKALEGVRSLPKVLRDPEARKVFLRNGMGEAQKLIDRPDLSRTLQDANVLQLSQALAYKLNIVPHVEVELWRKDDTNETVSALLTLKDIVGTLIDTNDLD